MAYGTVDSTPRNIPCTLKVHSYKGKDYEEFVGTIQVGNRTFLVKPQPEPKEFTRRNGDKVPCMWVTMVEYDANKAKTRKRGF